MSIRINLNLIASNFSNITNVNLDKISANKISKLSGSNGQYLMADGSTTNTSDITNSISTVSANLTTEIANRLAATTNTSLYSPTSAFWSRLKMNTLNDAPIDKQFTSTCWSSKLKLLVVVSGSSTGGIYTSYDCKTYTNRVVTQADWRSVCWSDEKNLFVAMSRYKIATSPNGTTWTMSTVSENRITCTIWVKELGLFIGVSNALDYMYKSTNGIDWSNTQPVYVYQRGIHSVCWSPERNMLVAVGQQITGGFILTSPDGINWTERQSNTGLVIISVCWSSKFGIFVALCCNQYLNANAIMKSSDGITWTTHVIPGRYWYGICWSDEIETFTVVGEYGSVSSIDSITWFVRNPIWIGLRNIVWVKDLFMFVSLTWNGTYANLVTIE